MTQRTTHDAGKGMALAMALIAASATGCSDAGPDGFGPGTAPIEPDIGQTKEAISNGTIVSADYSGNVNLILPEILASFCSGTLITNRWVLTARHCVEGRQPASLWVGMGNQIFTTDRILLHPNANEDVALVLLSWRATMLAFNNVPTDRGFVRPLDTAVHSAHHNGTFLCAGYGPGIFYPPGPTLRTANLQVRDIAGGARPLCFFRNASNQLQQGADSGGGCFTGPSLRISPVMSVLSYCLDDMCCSDSGAEWAPWVQAVLAYLGTGS